MGGFLAMPIKVKPYYHQQMAFDFACYGARECEGYD